MFIDEVVVELVAGNGGNGCLAFRREKGIPMGGPFGGNGGKGASVIFKVDEGLNTLLSLRYQKIIKAGKGTNGEGKGKHGAYAEDLIVKVPPGTVVTDLSTNKVIADLTLKNEEKIIAKGGRGGRGNIAFATRANPAPNFAENGEPGEIKKVKVELKLLADVGLVGFPSVGKSTLISKISASKPKIAEYHFTTLVPNLGVVKASNNRSFVVADLPGLIKGASLGEGLGDRFLKHIERTRVIAHIIDMSATDGRSPIEDYEIINKELEDYNPAILKKPQITIANKMDMEISLENLKKFKEKYPYLEIYEISSLTNMGLEKVINKLADMLDTIKKEPLFEEQTVTEHVVYTYEEEKDFNVYKEDDVWVIRGNKVEKLFKMTKFNTDEALLRFSNSLKRMGVDKTLKQLGAKDGDVTRILDYEFEYKEDL